MLGVEENADPRVHAALLAERHAAQARISSRDPTSSVMT
jgi:hypothetical protein